MKYYAYGSNMNPQRMQDRGLTFTERTVASLAGWELRFNKKGRLYPGFGAANINKKVGGMVEGFIYTIPDTDILKMDTFEGYPDHYARESVVVFDRGTSRYIDVITYIARPAYIQEGLLPRIDYLEHLLIGVKGSAFSSGYVAQLEAFQSLSEQATHTQSI